MSLRRLTKDEKAILAVDPFYCAGRVRPTEPGWDWKAQLAKVAEIQLRSGQPKMMVPFDIGKVLGLASYAAELEELAGKLITSQAVPEYLKVLAKHILTGWITPRSVLDHTTNSDASSQRRKQEHPEA